jgi:cell division septation protein DedD
VGALAVLVVLACAAIGLPRLFHTSAKTEADGDQATQTSPAPSSATSPVSASPVPAAPVAAPNAGPAEATPPATDANPAQTAVPSGTEKSTHAKTEGNAKSPRPDYHPDVQPDSGYTDSPRQSANTGPSAEEVNQAHEQMTGLDARASAVSASLEGLKRQQAADGLGLRPDMAAAYARMNIYLRSANDELNGGNITAASNHMDKADKEISTLESFLGK